MDATALMGADTSVAENAWATAGSIEEAVS